MTDTKRQPIRVWRAVEQELWLDMFTQFCATLTEDTLARTHRTPDPESSLSVQALKTPQNPPMPDAEARGQLREDIRVAAELADGVLEEVAYRKWIQTPPRTKPRGGPRRRK